MKRREPRGGVPRETPLEERLAELEAQFDLSSVQTGKLSALLAFLSAAGDAPSSVTESDIAVDVHIADSLSALELKELERPGVICDIGSGAGFPALVMAVARPGSQVFAVESAARKCRFIASGAAHLELDNLHVVWSRAEAWTDGVGTCDVVCARALAGLPVLCEYAAPLLRPNGVLVAWKGELDAGESEQAVRAAAKLGMSAPIAVPVQPYPGSRRRSLYRVRKLAETPPGFPRRPGMAIKRPLG